MATTTEETNYSTSFTSGPESPPASPGEKKEPSYEDGNLNHTDDDDITLDQDIREIKSWDEGGPSDCGYHESVHNTLMSVGGTVHRIIGEPSAATKSTMGAVGNWFQEASYAVRDIFHGKTDDMKENATVVVESTYNELMGKPSGEKKEGENPATSSADPVST